MQFVLLRHATRVHHPDRDTDDIIDMYMSLDGKGFGESLRLGNRLLAEQIQPRIYLTSWWLHARQTAEQLRDKLGGNSVAPVVELCILTPYCELEINLERVINESAKRHRELSNMEVMAIVTHKPRLEQLLAQITHEKSKSFFAALECGQGACLEAASLDDFSKGGGKIQFFLPEGTF
jgi:phosphohistidine phosphatase SixA